MDSFWTFAGQRLGPRHVGPFNRVYLLAVSQNSPVGQFEDGRLGELAHTFWRMFPLVHVGLPLWEGCIVEGLESNGACQSECGIFKGHDPLG